MGIIAWHNDHRIKATSMDRGKMPPMSKHAPKTKDNTGVICGLSSIYGGPHYTVNPNILLYMQSYINLTLALEC
jgi:hypothetical protein